MFDENKCNGCPIQGQYELAMPHGPEDAPYLIVTDIPSQTSVTRNVPLPPGQQKLLNGMLEAVDLTPDTSFQYHPACLCPFDPKTYQTKVVREIHKKCREHLVDFINDIKPECILPLGAAAATQVFGKPTKITKVRGLAHPTEEFDSVIYPLMSPAIALQYEQNRPVLEADIRGFGRLVEHSMDIKSAEDVRTGKYIFIDDLQFLIDADPEIIAFDTENTGLRYYQPGVDVRTYNPSVHKGNESFRPRFQILTMQFCIEPGKAYVLVWDHPERPIAEFRKPRLRNQLRKLLCDPKRIIVGQNTKYDVVALWMAEGIRARIGGDTQMLAAIYDENLPEKNLDILVKIHVPEMAGYADRFNSTVNKERMWEVPLETLLPYGAGDADATYRLYEVLEEKVAEDAGNWNHYCSVSLPGLNGFAAIETTGLIVDGGGALSDFQEFLTQQVSEQKTSLLSQIPKTIKREQLAAAKSNASAEKVLSFTRGDFIREVLFNHPDGFCLKPKVFTKTTANLTPDLQIPSTSSKDHLPYFFDECPFTFELAEHVKDDKLLQTNVIKFQEKFIVNGMVRPVYGMAKTVTRRTNSYDPNGQNFPKRSKRAKMYQRIYVAPEGHYIIAVDLSQAELRIAGEMARDPVITKIYMEDGDIHISTACIALGITEEKFATLPEDEQKSWRQKAKAINFGFIYGMSWRKFMGYAKTQYGVEFTEKQAKRIREAYFTKYTGLKRWHENTAAFVRKHGYIRSFSGLVRHLPMVRSSDEYVQAEAIRQGINSPVQEFGSTLGVIAMGNLHEDIDPKYLKLAGFIHDALYAYVPKQYLEWGLKTVRHYMESTDIKSMFGHDFRIPIKADPAFGLNMGDLFELKAFPRGEERYNWGHNCLKDKEGKLLVEVPPQRIPPGMGRRTESPYTSPDFREPETNRIIRRTR